MNTSRAQQVALALQRPSAVAYDAQGNLYFAERAGHTVHRMGPDGTLILIAGMGTQGFSGDGGPATTAQLDSPRGLALDGAGNVYIADTRNHRVRRVDAATGLITTVAGTGVAGFAGDMGAANSARLNLPTALAVDEAGDLFVADTANHRVRRVDAATAVITTAAGSGTEGFGGDNGPAAAAALDSPGGLAVDGAGNLYLADTRNHRVRRVDAASGIITTVAGMTLGKPGLPVESGDGGPAIAATLALPRGLAVDASGDVYLADSANHRVRRIAPGGTIATVAGQGTEAYAGDNGAPAAANLDSPAAVAVFAAGTLVLADGGNARLRQVREGGITSAVIQTVVGPGATLGTISTGTLALTGTTNPPYGSTGTWTAALTGGAGATGVVQFVDSADGVATTIARVSLVNGTATLSSSGLAAGTHPITASYVGDATHAPAQSQALSVTVAPLAVTASAQAAVAYGQTLPILNGTLTGVLAGDTGKVSAVFSTAAGALASPGFYPVSATLAGSAAGNYMLSSVTGSLTISRAPVTVAVVPSTTTPGSGAALTVNVQVLSTTAGTPGGSVTLLDGSSVLAQVALSDGVARFSPAWTSDGTHMLTATYTGDANFLPGVAAAATAVSVGAAADFTLAATGAATQGVPSGTPAAFTFSINGQGAALSSPITLAVAGLPTGVTASFNPAYIPPGGGVTSFTLTVITPKALAARGTEDASGGRLAAFLAAPLVLFATGLRRRKATRRRFPRIFITRRMIFAVLAGITSATLASGCASRVNDRGGAQTAPTYTLTVTGTATSATGTILQHAVSVTLQVL